ncbi:L,D-transpeptidase [Alteribacter populi]|uniref:L,D-transpeptidase n=1 Tax=Alteribacter populi TaxID=2011011 RepID=UPI001E4062DE|nr:L,D-transpeptidase [Alteribacter populi]
MVIRLMFMVLLVVSPIWPLGENPVPGDPYLVINKDRQEMAFLTEGEVKQVFPVAIGKVGDETPEGEFTILIKAINPYYRKGDIPGGDENNPLGSRWIGFDAENTNGRIFGIHGTNNPHSIGNAVTAGCIRMRNEDVEVLFEEIPIGMKVLVVNEKTSFEDLGRMHGAIE